MRLWDVFMLNFELDMLECRLTEMDGCPEVYRHVIVEARVDHQGHAKPLHYLENRERFAPWHDRIEHVLARAIPDGAGSWARERAQRDAALSALARSGPGDVVLIADVDEIPNRDAVRAASQVAGHTVLMQSCSAFAVDWLWPEPMRTSVAVPVRDVGDSLSVPRRDVAGTAYIHGAGHHLTWMGGADGWHAKMASHCHADGNGRVREILGADPEWALGVNPFPEMTLHFEMSLLAVDIDETWPWYVTERRCPASWFRPREAA